MISIISASWLGYLSRASSNGFLGFKWSSSQGAMLLSLLSTASQAFQPVDEVTKQCDVHCYPM